MSERSGFAGWSSIDITPPLGLPMGGRGPRFSPGASVMDPLITQALVLEDTSGRRTLWVSLDLIGLIYPTTARIRYELASATGIPPEAIILNFSHTHNGPMTNFDGYATVERKPEGLQAFEEDLQSKLLRMAAQALDRLQPVEIHVHHGSSDVGINRRNRGESGTMGLRPNLDGVYIPDVWVLDIAAESGDRAVVFNYACHPVTVYGYCWDGISPDYPGVCRELLSSSLGGAHAQFLQGPAGNVRPRRMADFETLSFRKPVPEDTTGAGSDLAESVLDALSSEGQSLALDLAFSEGTVLAPKDPDGVLPVEHWRGLVDSDSELTRNQARYWEHRFEEGIPPASCLPWSVGLLKLAPGHRIAWLSGEVFAEWRDLLREWLDDPALIVWGYCQDGRCYMPPDHCIPEGGYEIESANASSTTGPGPFAQGMNAAVRTCFQELSRRL